MGGRKASVQGKHNNDLSKGGSRKNGGGGIGLVGNKRECLRVMSRF